MRVVVAAHHTVDGPVDLAIPAADQLLEGSRVAFLEGSDEVLVRGSHVLMI
jgi:hypothetical protein